MLEVANGQRQALEARWSRGVWLGHARDFGDTLVADEEGVRMAWAVRRLPEDRQWDGDRIRRIKGSPKNWKIDVGLEEEMREEEKDEAEVGDDFSDTPMGSRAGEMRSLYMRKEDFFKYGHTPVCRWCMGIASGKAEGA